MEPYALSLWRRFKAGESVDDLAAAEGIRVDRIQARLAAAAAWERRQEENRRSCGGDELATSPVIR